MLSSSHRDNLLRWDPTIDGGHYESHFIKVNKPEENLALWWKFTVLQPLSGLGPARFEVWAIYFDVADPSRSCAAKATFGAGQTHIDRHRLYCDYGGNILEHDRSRGELVSDHHFRWDIEWEPPEAGFRHFPRADMYDGAFPKTKALSPTLSARISGSVRVDGRQITLDDDPGMQGHNWGKKHAGSWVWTHCNLFEDAGGAVFEAITSRINVGSVSSPQLTILHFDDQEGTSVTINGWLEMVRTSSDLRGLRWRFRGSQGSFGLEGVFHAPAERFVGVNYEDPDGRITHCLNSKVADGELRVLRKDAGIWRLDRSYSTRASAALEIGIKNDPRGVKIHL